MRGGGGEERGGEREREREREGSCSCEAFVSRPVTRARRIGEGRLAARERAATMEGRVAAGRVATSDQ